jgi:hypothetical protein
MKYKFPFGFITLSEAINILSIDGPLIIRMTHDLRLVKETALVFIPKKGGFVWIPTSQELIPLTGSNSNFSLVYSLTGLTSEFFELFIEIASNMHANSFNNKAIAQCEYTFFKSKFSLVNKMKLPNPLKGEVFKSIRFHQKLKLKPDPSTSMMPGNNN